MSNEEKIEYIKANYDVFFVSVNAYLSMIMLLIEASCTREQKPEEEKTEQEKMEDKVISECKKDIENFTIVRDKLLKKDFNLTPIEVARIGLGIFYSIAKLDREICKINKHRDILCNHLKTIFNMTPEELEKQNKEKFN